jgi:hypothetical protein
LPLEVVLVYWLPLEVVLVYWLPLEVVLVYWLELALTLAAPVCWSETAPSHKIEEQAQDQLPHLSNSDNCHSHHHSSKDN